MPWGVAISPLAKNSFEPLRMKYRRRQSFSQTYTGGRMIIECSRTH